MPEGLQVITQSDFSAGSFPEQENIPANGVEQIFDGLIRDDGGIARRGGSTYKSATAMTQTPVALWDGELAIGHRTLAFGTTSVMALDTDDATPRDLLTGVGASTHHRPVEVGGMVLMPCSTAGSRNVVFAWGGRVPTTAAYSTGTLTATVDSKTVTGVGTSWSANVNPGMVLRITNSGGHHRAAVVATVDSNTQITLTEEWPYATESGVSYQLSTVAQLTIEQINANGDLMFLAVSNGKLFAGQGNKVWASVMGASALYPQPLDLGSDEYHLLPAGATLRALQAHGDGILVFTSQGLWRISNAAFDLTDDFGNPQQQLTELSDTFVLWGQRGLTSWQGAVIAPGTSDVYLIAQSGEFTAFTGGAGKVYRDTFAANRPVGQATVYRGHYILPVLSNSTTSYLLFVWRMDMPRPPFVIWGRVSAVTPTAVATRAGTASLTPALLGTATTRLLDLTAYFDPSIAADEADGTSQQLQVHSRPVKLSETQKHTLRFARLRYELVDPGGNNPTFSAAWAQGRAGYGFTTLSGNAPETSNEESAVYTWPLAKSGQMTRMLFKTNNGASEAIIRAMEFKVRQHGRV